MMDWIVIGVVVLIVGIAVAYIIREKKRGRRCIGCPSAGKCGAHHGEQKINCSCGCQSK